MSLHEFSTGSAVFLELTPTLFSERLRATLQLRHLSLRRLAARTGIEATQLSHYARAIRLPSARNLSRLAQALDVPADFLLGREMSAFKTLPTSERMATLLDQASQLTSHHLDLLMGVAALLLAQKENA